MRSCNCMLVSGREIAANTGTDVCMTTMQNGIELATSLEMLSSQVDPTKKS